MATIYTANLVLTETEEGAMVVVEGFTGVVSDYALLFADYSKKQRCLVYSPIDGITGNGVQALLTAAGLPELRAAAQAVGPNNKARRDVDAWLTGGGFSPLTAAQVNWWDILHYVSWQVNPAFDLNAFFLA